MWSIHVKTAVDSRGEVITPHHMDQMQGREGQIVTINGNFNPNVLIEYGGLLRLRIVNAFTSRFYRLTLENHPLYLIATDAVFLYKTVEKQELLLTPGERVEVLIKGEIKPGQYRLFNLPYYRGEMGMMGGGMGIMWGIRNNNSRSVQVLATLNYSVKTKPIPLTQSLITVEKLPPPQTTLRFTLNHSMTPEMGIIFLINGNYFNPNRIDTKVKLNSVEDWEITNTGVMDHPFHLHTNPFQVINRNGIAEAYPSWKDTVLVKAGEVVRIPIHFKDFIGKSVYHCHILDHEDLGMMGVLEIVA
ncbi:MAG: multicopper oxidase domain-containing protein [Moorea sp. SIO2B7]|nr:multicopper oxidase domain-containing protein [Moorena sp. SIO2B7]